MEKINDKIEEFLEYLYDERRNYYEYEHNNEAYAIIKVIDKFKEIFEYEEE